MRHWTTEVHSLEARRKDEVLSLQEQRQVEIACVEEQGPSKLQRTGHIKQYSHGGWKKYVSSRNDLTREAVRELTQDMSEWVQHKTQWTTQPSHAVPKSRNPGHGIPTPNTFASKSIARDLQAATTRAPSSDERMLRAHGRTPHPFVGMRGRHLCVARV